MTDQYYSATPKLDTSPVGRCAPDHAPIERSSGPHPTGADSRAEARAVYAALAHLLGRPVKVLEPGCRPNRPSPAFPSCPAPAEDAPEGCDLALCAVSGPNRDASDRAGLLSAALGLAHTAGAVLFEAEWKDDPANRHDVLPDDLERLRRAFSFVHTIAEYDAGQGCRALLFCSNRYWYAAGRIGAFDSWTPYANERVGDARLGTRRYFFCADTIIKSYTFYGLPAAENRLDMEREISFLSHPPVESGRVPRLIAHRVGGHDGTLATERLPGMLLSTAVLQKKDYTASSVLSDILERLEALEKLGLYHNDIGQWNILLDENGNANLIDYASITDELRSRHWPHDPITHFFLFAVGVIDRRFPLFLIELFPFRPSRLPRFFRRWAALVGAHPADKRNFALLKACFNAAFNHHSPRQRKPGISGWLARWYRRFVYWRSLVALQTSLMIGSIRYGGLRPTIYRLLGLAVRSFTARPLTALAPIGRPRP